MKKHTLEWISIILVIIGAINWGLVGIGGWNVVSMIFGAWPIVERIIYVLVGLAGVAELVMLFKK